MKQTHSFAILELSPSAFTEIERNLKQAGYSHAIRQEDGREIIDMQGIAVTGRTCDFDSEGILKAVALEFGVSITEMVSRKRPANIALARHVAMTMIREFTDATYCE